jgi:metallo-beta-lactamase class B
MPLNSTSTVSPSPEILMQRVCREPWKAYLEPIRMAPGVWYISGNDWVASYLIDTGDGLILIDTALHESCYLLLENIRQLGFDPHDIKKILLSHAHIDHIGAAKTLKELTGAAVYLGKRDLYFLHERTDLIGCDFTTYTCGLFEPDELYDDTKSIVQGNIIIDTVSSPGHTPGCTSFFFTVTDKNGKKLRCGMHGGVGLNTMSDEYFKTSGLPVSLREEFADGLQSLDKLTVDITLPSHTNQVGILLLKDSVTDDFNPFIDASIWHDFMHERYDRVRQLVNR